jgi:hypothetical protein
MRPRDDREVVALRDVLYDNAFGLKRPDGPWSFGWRGPYVQDQIGSDPWGNRYVVEMGRSEGAQIFVLSAGPDRVIDLEMGQAGLKSGGDDIVYVLSSTS